MPEDLMGDNGPTEELVRKAVEDEREACCLAVCWFCEMGMPLVPGQMRHDISRLRGPGAHVPCDAAAIRRRGAA